MKLRLVLTNDITTTKVVNAETGEPISGIKELTLHYEASAAAPMITMKIVVLPDAIDIDSFVEEDFVNVKSLLLK